MSTAKVKKCQAACGLLFAVFLSMHFISHYSLNISYETADSNLRFFRLFYQNPIFEFFLVFSFIGHMYCNTQLYLARSKLVAAASGKKEVGAKKPKGTLELNAHRYAGYTLAVLIFGHVYATRIGPLMYLDDPSVFDYSFASTPYNMLPFYGFPIYYVVFAIVGGWHMIFGVYSALATLQGGSIVGKPVPIYLKVLAFSSHIAIIGAVVALGGYREQLIANEAERKGYFKQSIGMDL